MPAGAYDFNNSPGDTFNGSAMGIVGYGGGTILATIGADVLAAYWETGAAPGNTAIAGQPAVFPGPRLLYNLDNDAPGGDLGNLTPLGLAALTSALDFYTPLTAIPEPASALLGLVGLAVLARRRRP